MNILRKSLVLIVALSFNASICLPPAAARMAAAVVRPMPIGQSGAAAAALALPSGLHGSGISLLGANTLPAITAPSLWSANSLLGAPSAAVIPAKAVLAPAMRMPVGAAALKTQSRSLPSGRAATAAKPGVLGGLTRAAEEIGDSMVSGRVAGTSRILNHLFGEDGGSEAPPASFDAPANDGAQPDRKGSMTLNGEAKEIQIYGTGWNVKRIVIGGEEFSVHSQSKGELIGSLVVKRNGRIVEEKTVTIITDPDRIERLRQNYEELAEEWGFTNKDEIAPAENHNAFVMIGDDHNAPYPMVANFAQINDSAAARLDATAGKITAAKLPGIYAAKLAIPGPYLAVEIRIKADNTYTFRQGNMDEVSPAFEGTWEFKKGVFIGRLSVPGFDEPVIQEIDLKGKTMTDLKNGVQVMVKSSLLGPEPLPFNIRKTDKPFFPSK